MNTPEATVVDNEADARFELYLGTEPAGFIAYRRAGGVLSLDHTEVHARIEGRGLGSRLVGGTLERARQADEVVLPFCEFIQSYIARHPAWIDLVPEPRRAEFGLSPAASR